MKRILLLLLSLSGTLAATEDRRPTNLPKTCQPTTVTELKLHHLYRIRSNPDICAGEPIVDIRPYGRSPYYAFVTILYSCMGGISVASYTADGHYYVGTTDHPLDLVEDLGPAQHKGSQK